jgi:hypothetical protein
MPRARPSMPLSAAFQSKSATVFKIVHIPSSRSSLVKLAVWASPVCYSGVPGFSTGASVATETIDSAPTTKPFCNTMHAAAGSGRQIPIRRMHLRAALQQAGLAKSTTSVNLSPIYLHFNTLMSICIAEGRYPAWPISPTGCLI